MPRKQVLSPAMLISAIIANVAALPLEHAEIAAELVNQAMKARRQKSVKAVRAAHKAADGSTSTASAAVDQATASAVGAGSAGSGTAPAKARKKPGPKKGAKRGVAGKATGPVAVEAAADHGITNGDLPLQTGAVEDEHELVGAVDVE